MYCIIKRPVDTLSDLEGGERVLTVRPETTLLENRCL